MASISQTLDTMDEDELRDCLYEVINNLQAEDMDAAYATLRKWYLEDDDHD